MNKHYKSIRTTIIIIAIIIIILLFFFTIDVINEEPDWILFDIDFTSPTVSHYATLINGLLSFLAILFVIFNIIEQRETIEKEKKLEKEKVVKDYKNRLKLLASLLLSVSRVIKEHGESMKEYYELELANPTKPNQTYFTVNKSFNRILEMDYSSNYLVFQHFFKEDERWEKDFMNMNSFVDFYSESLIEHREKYQYHIKDKVIRHQEINEICKDFLSLCSKQIDIYRESVGTDNYLNEEWVIICNEFIPAFYEYLEECNIQQKATDFRHLSDIFFLRFLENAMELRNTIGYDEYYSRGLVELALSIRKKIYEVEMYSIQYAENVKYHYGKYFNENSDSFKQFQNILDKINSKVESI